MKRNITKLNDYENEFKEAKDFAIKNTISSFNISQKIIDKYNNLVSKFQENFEEFGFIIYIEPRGASRPRAGSFGQVYQPSVDRKYQETIRLYIDELLTLENILDSELEIDISFYKQLPVNTPKLKALLSEYGIIRPLTIPDLDNCEKILLDAFNVHENKRKGKLYGLYTDDKLITSLSSKKFYSSVPRIEVVIRVKKNDNL